MHLILFITTHMPLSLMRVIIKDNHGQCSALVMQSDIEMVLPIKVGGYTDFFCSMLHTRNYGFIFRGP
jgi:fumarylacetoacetase